MLRRPPTSISLTSDDIDAYERARLQRLQQDRYHQRVAATSAAENPLANPTANATTAIKSFSSSSMSPVPAGASALTAGFEDRSGTAAADDADSSRGGGGRRTPGDFDDGMRPSAAQERERARIGRTREERIMGTGNGADVGRRAGGGVGMGRG